MAVLHSTYLEDHQDCYIAWDCGYSKQMKND